jgi:type II secretory pathway pseudopilin PulG
VTSGGAAGSSLVDLLVVVAILGALASIGVPQYTRYSEHRREAQCVGNRNAIEEAERACQVDHGKPCLSTAMLTGSGYLSAPLTCPSEGRYVWIANKPSEERYPLLGCSKHFWR